MLKTILRPELFHGIRRKPPFFEGWYYKVVSRDEAHRFAFIPGIYLHEKQDECHAFVQVLDGTSGRTHFHRYPVGAFEAKAPVFELKVGESVFARDRVSLTLDGHGQRIRGSLTFRGVTPWPVTLRSPGIMGWYAWVPFMECYHGVLSLDHEIHGSLQVDGVEVDFSGGRGYIEKDWGQSFPSAHIWMQSNHFGIEHTSLTASIAIIPWVRSSFRGFIIGFFFNGHLYRFATYTGATVRSLRVDDSSVDWVIADRTHELTIHAVRSGGGLLHAPTTTEMSQRLHESLTGLIDLELRERGGRTLFSGSGRNAGLEIGGNVESLLACSG